MTTHENKRQKIEDDDDTYHLIYWPGIPGRGEFIRLILEESGAKYTDTAHMPKGIDQVLTQISDKNTGNDNNSSPPPLAPPILKHGTLTLSQTPSILQYLGTRHNLVPSPTTDPTAVYHINALTLTALDGLSNEPHDTHHPIAVSAYYEDQIASAKLKAKDYRVNRLPKFLSYFERVLTSSSSSQSGDRDGEYLYGGRLTYADIVLFQCIDGVKFAFPKAMKRLEASGQYKRVFGLYERIKGRERIRAYLGSERRQGYGMGVYRYYEELDDQEGDEEEEEKGKK